MENKKRQKTKKIENYNYLKSLQKKIMKKQQIKNMRNKYKKIDENKRMEIIDRIINKGQQLKIVSEDSGINVSTCKAIIKVYQEQGRIGKKKTRNKIVDVIQTYSFYILQNSKLTQITPYKILNCKISAEQKQFIQNIIQNQCQQKAKKMLIDAVQNYKKLQQQINATQLTIENKNSGNQPNYASSSFYSSC